MTGQLTPALLALFIILGGSTSPALAALPTYAVLATDPHPAAAAGIKSASNDFERHIKPYL
jgi:hypothetical protein